METAPVNEQMVAVAGPESDVEADTTLVAAVAAILKAGSVTTDETPVMRTEPVIADAESARLGQAAAVAEMAPEPIAGAATVSADRQDAPERDAETPGVPSAAAGQLIAGGEAPAQPAPDAIPVETQSPIPLAEPAPVFDAAVDATPATLPTEAPWMGADSAEVMRENESGEQAAVEVQPVVQAEVPVQVDEAPWAEADTSGTEQPSAVAEGEPNAKLEGEGTAVAAEVPGTEADAPLMATDTESQVTLEALTGVSTDAEASADETEAMPVAAAAEAAALDVHGPAVAAEAPATQMESVVSEVAAATVVEAAATTETAVAEPIGDCLHCEEASVPAGELTPVPVDPGAVSEAVPIFDSVAGPSAEAAATPDQGTLGADTTAEAPVDAADGLVGDTPEGGIVSETSLSAQPWETALAADSAAIADIEDTGMEAVTERPAGMAEATPADLEIAAAAAPVLEGVITENDASVQTSEIGSTAPEPLGREVAVSEALPSEHLASETVTPETLIPETRGPDALTPETVIPEGPRSEALTSEALTSETLALETVAPETVAPETVAPEILTPQTVTTEDLALETPAPEALTSGALAAETLAPEALAAETLTPETVVGEALAPEALAPETLTPATLAADAPIPETLDPEARDPEALAPEVAFEAPVSEAVAPLAGTTEVPCSESTSMEAPESGPVEALAPEAPTSETVPAPALEEGGRTEAGDSEDHHAVPVAQDAAPAGGDAPAIAQEAAVDASSSVAEGHAEMVPEPSHDGGSETAATSETAEETESTAEPEAASEDGADRPWWQS